MEKVNKISIGGFVFALSVEAENKIMSYLNTLNEFYKEDSNCEEIIEGIEERMAELFLERTADGIVSGGVAEEVINILGWPESMEDESKSHNVKKKLYRNLSEKLIGGVCSGIAVYFKIDPILIRLLVSLPFIGLMMYSMDMLPRFIGEALGPISVFLFGSYILLWVITPKASTLEQRYEMEGKKPNISSIKRELESNKTKFTNRDSSSASRLGSFLLKIIGIVLILFGLMGTLFGIFSFSLGGELFLNFHNALFPSNSSWLYILLVAIAYFIPLIGLLYQGIVILFSFSRPKWKPGFVLFATWIVSLFILAGLTTKKVYKFANSKHYSDQQEMTIGSDTLFIKFVDVEKWDTRQFSVKANSSKYDLLFIDKERKESLKIIDYPAIYVRKEFSDKDEVEGDVNAADLFENDTKEVTKEFLVKIRESSTLFLDDLDFYETRKLIEGSMYRLEGNILYVNPIIYSKETPLKTLDSDLRISVHEDMKLVIMEPIHHEFKASFNYSNIFWL